MRQIPFRETNPSMAQLDASASLPIVSLPGGVPVSRFHHPLYATTGAERQTERAAQQVIDATAPYTPTRSPNPFQAVQSRLVLTYDRPRTATWGEQ
jgi:hypothetical protein